MSRLKWKALIWLLHVFQLNIPHLDILKVSVSDCWNIHCDFLTPAWNLQTCKLRLLALMEKFSYCLSEATIAGGSLIKWIDECDD